MSAMAAPPPERSVGRQGNYAGAVSRGVAFGVDIGASWGLYTLGALALDVFVQLVSGHSFELAKHPADASAVLTVWVFLYFAGQWALGGQTMGMAIFGLRVVKSDGSPITTKAAVIRTLTLPLSIAVFFLGFLGILTNRQRQGWHDKFAGTVVVYDWDARAARLRWLARNERMGGATAIAAAPSGTAAGGPSSNASSAVAAAPSAPMPAEAAPLVASGQAPAPAPPPSSAAESASQPVLTPPTGPAPSGPTGDGAPTE